jgi:dienelactone hydrolase
MYDAIASQAEDVIAAAKWANSQQWSSGQMILEGQSGGGSAVVAAAAYNEPYIKGVVNFSGLRGSQDNGVPCGLEQQNEIMRSIGRATRTPQLWIYANNDAKIRADIATQWANIVNSSGGNVKLLITKSIMKENGGDDGHSVMFHKELYETQMNSFLSSVMSSSSSPMAYRNNKTNQFVTQNGTIKIIRYNVNTNM